MGITKHQEQKAEEVMFALYSTKRAVLNGSAGVGKTWLANYIINQMAVTIPSNKDIYVSAPTNKAVAVIKDKVKTDRNVTFITTHSALKMKREIDRYSGEVRFKSFATEKNPALRNVRLLVVDEASMLNEEMLTTLERFATMQGCMVLFIGDDKQLPPVGEDSSKVFTSGYATATLTEIIRQGAGNPIIDLSRDLKRIWTDNTITMGWSGKEVSGVRNDVGGYIYSNDLMKVVDTLAYINGTNDLKYLAWTNEAVNSMNKKVRQRIYGRPNLIELSESLIFDAPYGKDAEGISLYYTNEEINVEELQVISRTISYPIKSNNITGEYEKNTINLKLYSINPGVKNLTDGVVVVHEDSVADYKKILKKMRANCISRDLEWVDFFGFSERFAQVKYNHAITVHKSQGSTYKQAILNVKDINRNRKKEEKEKLLYTAVTRASDLLILYNV